MNSKTLEKFRKSGVACVVTGAVAMLCGGPVFGALMITFGVAEGLTGCLVKPRALGESSRPSGRPGPA